MADIYGDLNLNGGRLNNFRVELLTELPTPTVEESGRIFFYDSNFYCNINGNHKVFQLTENDNTIRDLFGTEWVNPDMSFNPDRFNNFQTINGLDADSNLYTVLAKLDQSISENSKKRFTDLDDVVVAELESNGILLFNGAEVIAVSFSSLIENYANFNISQVEGVNLLDLTQNDVMFYDGDVFVNKKLSVIKEYNNPPLSFTVEHNLGSKYNMISLINNADQVIPQTEYTITFLNINQFVLTLGSALPFVRVLVHSVY